MRNLFFTLLIMALASGVKAQDTVNCTHLRVTGIQMHTTDTMVVTLFNNCTSCMPVGAHCVYHEMLVIHNVAPFDTIGSSKCWCHQIPASMTAKNYSINSTVTSLPPTCQLRVMFFCGSPTCDDIPFDVTGGMTGSTLRQSLKIYPNPAGGHLLFRADRTSVFDLSIYSMQGALLLKVQQLTVNGSADISALATGIYLAEARDERGEILLRTRVVRE